MLEQLGKFFQSDDTLVLSKHHWHIIYILSIYTFYQNTTERLTEP